jgi:nitrous oxide reductase
MKSSWVLIGLLVGVVLISVYTQQHTTPVSAQAAPVSSVVSTGAVKEIPLEISIRGFSPWNPSTWVVNQGDTVKIMVTSVSGEYSKGVTTDAEEHTFVIDEYNIREVVPAGKSIMVEFQADARAERVAFYCDKPGHRYQENGMIEIRKPKVTPTGVMRVVPISMNIKGFSMPPYQYFHATSNAVYVNLGDTVRFMVSSVDDKYAKGVEQGAKEHHFNINEYDIHRVVPAGETIIVEFLADKPGMFTFYDDIPQYKIQTQGVLVVR